MESVISSAVAVVPMPAFPFADPLSPLVAGGLSARETRRVPAVPGTTTVAVAGVDGAPRRLLTALGDVLGIVSIAYAIPVVILALGVPLALFVRLVIWSVRAL